MKVKHTYLFSLLILMMLSLRVSAQQGHLTQFFNASLYVNPAEAGAENKIRVGLNYRRQWPSIATGYTTKALNTDMMIGKFGYGLIISSNGAGKSSLNQMNVLFNIAHHIQLTSKSRLSAGIQLGLTQYNIDANQLQFDSQYTQGSGYNSNIFSGENITSNSVSIFSSGVGLVYRNSNKWNPSLSFSVKNLIESRLSFTQYGDLVSSRQVNIFGDFNRKVTPKVSIIPYMYYSMHAKASYLQSGVRLGYELASNQQFQVGFGVLKKDAFLAYVGIPYKNLLVGISYDINTSRLTPVTNGVGAFEFSFLLKFKQKEKEDRAYIDNSKVEINSLTIKRPRELELSIHKELILTTPSLKTEIITEKASVQSLIENKATKSVPVQYNSITPERMLNHYFVYFDSDKSTIKEEYFGMLNQLISELNTASNYIILVNGHTDSDGDGLYNLYLGEARSQQVMRYLLEHGIDIDKIQTFTYGKTNPVVDNSSEAKKAKNRRAEILIIRK